MGLVFSWLWGRREAAPALPRVAAEAQVSAKPTVRPSHTDLLNLLPPPSHPLTLTPQPPTLLLLSKSWGRSGRVPRRA